MRNGHQAVGENVPEFLGEIEFPVKNIRTILTIGTRNVFMSTEQASWQ
jgi:hypothetical protein